MWNTIPNMQTVLIVAIVMAVPVLIVWMIVYAVSKKRESDIIKLAIEKGQPIPELPVSRRSKSRTLKCALIWMAIGIGVILAILIESGGTLEGAGLGIIPILIGVALWISWIFERRVSPKSDTQAN